MTTPLMRALICAALLLPLPARAQESKHPSLLLSPEGVTQLKTRIATADFARAQFDAMKKRVDATLKQPVDLPPRGSNWYHWYVCPKHGNRLVTGKPVAKWQWEHVCPVDKETFRGAPSTVQTDFDGCRLAGVNGDYAATARDAGILYQVTRDRRYADKAREILLAYADKYADYPLHTTRNEPKIGGGKVGAQTLDESVWLIPMAQAADLVWDVLSPDQRTTLAQKLFLPAARDVILPHKMAVHNIQCWKNSAVGLVGFLLGDKDLIRAAIDDDKSGYRTQMAKGVSADGQWWEGAWGYHFYTAQACWPLVEAARNNGVDLWGAEYKRLFDGPLSFAMPNLVLPDFSDSHEVNVAAQESLYELAYARYREPKYLALLTKSDRANPTAMLFGVTPLPGGAATEVTSANFPATGYAILRAGATAGAAHDKDTWLCLKYGPHGGGHGHPDKLSFVLYANGKTIAPDAGITSYGTPLHQGWYRTTIAHSTLTVDQANQKEATGQCLAFGSTNGVDFVCADAGKIYLGVRYARTIAMLSPQLVVVVDQVRADKPHTFDLAYHQRGTFDGTPTGQPWASPDKPGYKYLKDARLDDLSAAPIKLLDDVGSAAITIASDAPAQRITATGPGHNTADRVPAIIVRHTATDFAVAWAIDLTGRATPIDLKPSTPGTPSAQSARVTVAGKILEITPVAPSPVRIK